MAARKRTWTSGIRIPELTERLRKHKAGELKGQDRMTPLQVKAAKYLVRLVVPGGEGSKKRPLARIIEKAVKEHVIVRAAPAMSRRTLARRAGE